MTRDEIKSMFNNFSEEEIDAALKELLNHGLVTVTVDSDGDATYTISEFGEVFLDHSESDINSRN